MSSTTSENDSHASEADIAERAILFFDLRYLPLGCVGCPAGESKKQLQFCSGCRFRKFCSPECQVRPLSLAELASAEFKAPLTAQKEYWPVHRIECRAIAQHRQYQDSKSQEEKDLKAYRQVLCQALPDEMALASNSALLLGRPTDRSADHFIAVHLIYTAPSSPVDLDDVLGVRKLFKFVTAKVMADSEAPERLQRQLHLMRTSNGIGKDLLQKAFFVVFVKSDIIIEEGNCLPFMLGPKDGLDIATDSVINPYWVQFIEFCFKRVHYPTMRLQRQILFKADDLAFIRKPEYIQVKRRKARIFAHCYGEIIDEEHRISKAQGDAAASKWCIKELERLRDCDLLENNWEEELVAGSDSEDESMEAIQGR